LDGLDEAAATGMLVFHAGTTIDPDGTARTAGGRVLSVVGRGADLATAGSAAAAAADLVRAPGLQRRHDIGSQAIAAVAGR
ncbi:MAG: phosphoribosylglycinamide synthetase C domain-containing protein, partial [Candidatus Limnocylindrales bacterium]